MPGDIVVYDNKAVRKLIAEEASKQPEFKAAAARVAAEVAAQLAKHVRTGKLASSVRVFKGRTDYHVEVNSVSYSWHTEFGHFQGRSGRAGRKWVRGINAFRSVVARHGGF